MLTISAPTGNERTVTGMAKYYIDREGLIEWLKRVPLKDLSDGLGLCRVIMEEDFAKAIKKMPKGIIVDVAPVRPGRWETNSDMPDTLICSVCKCGFDMWKHDPHNFCPNCGAMNVNGGRANE